MFSIPNFDHSFHPFNTTVDKKKKKNTGQIFFLKTIKLCQISSKSVIHTLTYQISFPCCLVECDSTSQFLSHVESYSIFSSRQKKQNNWRNITSSAFELLTFCALEWRATQCWEFFIRKIAIFSQFQVYLNITQAKQIVNLLLLSNNFYPVISYRSDIKKRRIICCIRFRHSLWSANQLPTQGIKHVLTLYVKNLRSSLCFDRLLRD